MMEHNLVLYYLWVHATLVLPGVPPLTVSLLHRRYRPPPRYEEVVTTLEPPPFADLFSEVEDFLSEVRAAMQARPCPSCCGCGASLHRQADVHCVVQANLQASGNGRQF